MINKLKKNQINNSNEKNINLNKIFTKPNKKADLSLNYIFKIFIGVIVIFLIVGLITKWSFKSKDLVKTLFPDQEEDFKKQVIKLDNCDSINSEIAKHIYLCYKETKKYLNENNKIDSLICFVIQINKEGCKLDKSKITNEMESYDGFNQYDIKVNENYKNKKLIIQFDGIENKVVVS